MNKIIIIAFFFFSFSAKSQNITTNSLTGTWNVENIINPPTNPNFKQLVDAFKSAKFYFKENKSFELKSKMSNQMFSMITAMTNQSKWMINEKSQLIKIGGEKDDYSIMGIIIKKKDGKTFFYLDESNILLEVKKIV